MNAPDITFATALNCIDGRAQLPVNEAVRRIFDVSCVDTITAPGMVRFLSDDVDAPETAAALSSVRISLDKHGSQAIAVAAHHDCAGNPHPEQTQKEQLARAVRFLQEQFPGPRIVGLWVDADGAVETVAFAPSE